MVGTDGETQAGHPEREAGAFFGRRKSKPLTAQQELLYRTLLPAIRIDPAMRPPDSLGALFDPPATALRLEIGFGGGEHLAHEAARSPETGFIGAEAFVNGVAKALVSIEANRLGNVRLFDQDATRLLDWLPAAALDRVDLLYPDPWRKRRHWKRRFVSADNLRRIVRVLKPGGEFRFASDIDAYVDWTLRHVLAAPELEWTARRAADWLQPWEGWIRTRYEAKAIREGRRPAYLVFRKIASGAR